MHIIIFGDSISQGFFDSEEGGWASMLFEYLQKKTIASDYTVYHTVFNQSISGESTSMIVSRFDEEITRRLSSSEQNIIVFAGGINDAKRTTEDNKLLVTVEETTNHVQTFIEKAKKISDNIFVVGLTRANEEITKLYDDYIFLNKDIEAYDARIESISTDNNVVYISLKDLVKYQHLADGLHPNTEGHRLIFEKVKSSLEADNLL